MHRGWVARARRLLEQADDEAGRGWVVLDDALGGSDLEVQRSQYLEAIDVARRTGDHDLECDATASLGMMLVFSGQVDEGMAHLDEALAAICGGDVSELPVVEGCLCGLITACERTHDVTRAEEWLRAAEQVMRRDNLLAVAGHCRAHYAGILVAAGRWADAEDELIGALDLLPEGIAVWDSARCRLADLRVRQGRLEEAEQLLAGLDHHEDAVLRSRPFLATARMSSPSSCSTGHWTGRARGPRDGAAVGRESRRSPRARRSGSARRSSECSTRSRMSSRPRTGKPLPPSRAPGSVPRPVGDARACWHQALTKFAAAQMPAEIAAARVELARVISTGPWQQSPNWRPHIKRSRISERAAAPTRRRRCSVPRGPTKTGPKRK